MLGHMLLPVFNINTKAYVRGAFVRLHLTLVALKVNVKVIQISKGYIS